MRGSAGAWGWSYPWLPVLKRFAAFVLLFPEMAHSHSSPGLDSAISTKVLYFTDRSLTPFLINIPKRWEQKRFSLGLCSRYCYSLQPCCGVVNYFRQITFWDWSCTLTIHSCIKMYLVFSHVSPCLYKMTVCSPNTLNSTTMCNIFSGTLAATVFCDFLCLLFILIHWAWITHISSAPNSYAHDKWQINWQKNTHRLGEVTLRDFKAAVDRQGSFRYHFKALDPEFGTVKEEVGLDLKITGSACFYI